MITTILKRTTAIAALAALPLTPISASAESQDGTAKTEYEAQDGLSESQSAADEKTGVTAPAEKPVGETAGAAAGNSSDKTAEGGGGSDTSDSDLTKGAIQSEGPTSESAAQSGVTPQADDAGAASDSETAAGAAGEPGEAGTAGEEDVLIARVGEADIMRSDVLGVIELLPPHVQQQPPETVISMAVEQLILRELILQEARGEGLESDPDVQSLLDEADTSSEEDVLDNAMVQVWLDRELEQAVTAEAVEETYDTVQNQFGDQVPPLDEIRPQIEEEVRRQAFLTLSDELHTNADVTLFGPDGEPVE